MELRDVKIGLQVNYRGRKTTGTATVTDIKTGATGPYVVLRDDTANRFIDLRPSQFDPVKAKKPRAKKPVPLQGLQLASKRKGSR